MNNLEWMKRLASADPTRAGSIVARPFSVEAHGKPWNVVTDGIGIVAVEGPPLFEPPDAERWIRAKPQIAGCLGHSRDGGPTFPLSALREWCGAPVWPVMEKCVFCDGTGKDCGIKCAECNGAGKSPSNPRPRPGALGSVGLDQIRIARAIEHLPDGPVELITDGARDPIFLLGDGWRVVLMPLVIDRYPDAPVFNHQKETPHADPKK